ncbi:MAG: DNA mismatch repair endonuclease MutL, partial [Calditrichales bacterium]
MEKVTQDIHKIHILPVSLSNKIAAGEVVERPASAVKELIENAIDAGATEITLVLKQSGKDLIQVIDNGQGIGRADLSLAFKRHATSKITNDEDLEQIVTLGFRGEALPSIASVSRVEITSRVADEPVASRLIIEAGKLVKSDRLAAPVGTNIKIKNLFFNTPARRNFLRADSTELQQIIAIIKRFFLSCPDIEFKVVHNDDELFHLRSANIDERLKDVFGEEQRQALIPVHDKLGGIELSGFISKPDKVRRVRGNQFLFLNGRPIQHKSLQHAIMQGYANLIQPGDFPLYCIFIELDPRLVDVNVHPSKMEVRFSNERSLYHFFMTTIRKAFHDQKIIPRMDSRGSEAFLAKFSDQAGREPVDVVSELKNRRRFMSGNNQQQLSLVYFQNDRESEN